MELHNYSILIRGQHYDAIQFGQGKADLVIIPGLGDGITTVRNKALPGSILYRNYARRYRVTVISRKQELEPGSTTEDMARDQALAMMALGLRDAYVVGISQGGMIAQHLAADHPELVSKLVLVVTVPESNQMIRKNVLRWLQLSQRGDYRTLMASTTEKAHPEEKLRRLRPFYPITSLSARKMDPVRFRIQAISCATHDAREKLSRIRVPTLIFGGGLDKTLGVQGARELHRAIPGSQLIIYPDQSHALYEDEPDFHIQVMKFLGSI